jgi:LPXTG-motif cell wall-anchored protein
MNAENSPNKSILNGVFLGYLVLLLHILLILGLGVTVILIKGIYDFRWLIIIAGIVLIGGSGYLFYKRIKESNRSLRDTLNDPALRDRTLEISLFGGMAAVKLGHKDQTVQLIEATGTQEIMQLQAPASQVNELGQLAKMLEDELITREEFQQLKQKIVSQQ